MKPTEQTQTTTSGAPLRHDEYAIPPKHIPNGKGEPFKTELVISRDPDGSTVKMNWWHAPDDDRAPHNHPWDFESTILHGGLTEVRFSPGSNPSWFDVSVRSYRAGETYRVAKEEYHIVVAVLPGTVTRMVCGPATKDNEWGYIENIRVRDADGHLTQGYEKLADGTFRPETLGVSANYVRAQKDPGFMARFVALNPLPRQIASA